MPFENSPQGVLLRICAPEVGKSTEIIIIITEAVILVLIIYAGARFNAKEARLQLPVGGRSKLSGGPPGTPSKEDVLGIIGHTVLPFRHLRR